MTAALVALLALRRRRWWLAAAAGVVAGLDAAGRAAARRPARVEVYRARRGRRRERLRRAGGRGGRRPSSGPVAYLAVGRAPQRRLPVSAARPAGVDEPGRLDRSRSAPCGAPRTLAGDGGHLSAGIHVVTAVVLVVLVVVLWRRWPLSFTAYAIAAVVVGLSARNLDSLERYSLSTVPLVLAAADVTGERDARARGAGRARRDAGRVLGARVLGRAGPVNDERTAPRGRAGRLRDASVAVRSDPARHRHRRVRRPRELRRDRQARAVPDPVSGKVVGTYPSQCSVGDQIFYNAEANTLAAGHGFVEPLWPVTHPGRRRRPPPTTRR